MKDETRQGSLGAAYVLAFGDEPARQSFLETILTSVKKKCITYCARMS